ncbi:MAG TPA: hypothetical protein VJQ57_14110 [Acidimicrobiia bacterium]|nr:hypothetical protein [Acidimicrobiia bacterium]
MSAPFIFVASYKVRRDQFEDYKPWVKELCRFVESKEPRMIAFNIYANADGTEVTAIQVHPEAGSMETHMQVVSDYIQQAYGDFLERPTFILACGEGESARAMIKQLTPNDFPLVAMPQHLGGFTRSSAAD